MEEESTSDLDCNIKIDLTSLMDSCRICMAQSIYMSCIFDPDKENVIDEIHYCTGVRVSIIYYYIILFKKIYVV